MSRRDEAHGAAARGTIDADSSDRSRAREEEGRRWSSWMAAAQRGDADAYRKLLGELNSVLRRYLHRLLGDPTLTEDGVQETLLAVHRARHTYDPKRAFRPWLIAIARHKAIDLVRRGNNPTHAAASHDEELEGDDRDGNRPEATLEAARLLAALPVAFREAIVLTKIQGQTVEEAARQAGVSATAMRSRVHRAMRQLRRRLDEEPL